MGFGLLASRAAILGVKPTSEVDHDCKGRDDPEGRLADSAAELANGSTLAVSVLVNLASGWSKKSGLGLSFSVCRHWSRR